MSKCDDAFGDACYEAWRRGLNPDDVSRERVCEDVDNGWDRFDAADRESGRLQRKRNEWRRIQEAMEQPEEFEP